MPVLRISGWQHPRSAITKKGASALKHALACCVPVLSCNIPRCTLSPSIPPPGRSCRVQVTCREPGLSWPVFAPRVCGFDSTRSLRCRCDFTGKSSASLFPVKVEPWFALSGCPQGGNTADRIYVYLHMANAEQPLSGMSLWLSLLITVD